VQVSDEGYERPVVVTAVASTLPVTVGGDGCRVVPLERWDADAYRSGAYMLETRFGAFVAAADSFDAAAFSISRQAAHLH
jgi:acyl transferase domain-containing protein